MKSEAGVGWVRVDGSESARVFVFKSEGINTSIATLPL